MGWFCFYLCTVIVCPVVIAGFYCERSEDRSFKIVGLESAVNLAFMCLGWPIVACVLLYGFTTEAYKEYYRSRCANIIERYGLGFMSTHDRTGMIEVPEKDLKFLLKSYRKKRFNLNKKIVELVRDELMNRTAERSLLK